MNRTQPSDDERELLASVRDDWIRYGLSTEPADRDKAYLDVLNAYRPVNPNIHSPLFIWVDSPMAGVIASTYVGFAFGQPMKARLMEPLDKAISANVPAALEIRREVDETVWRVRDAIHAQVAADLTMRETDPKLQRMKYEIGNYAWHQAWLTIGDPGYTYLGYEDQARNSEGLFEENLKPWADAMMEGQFSAGAMAQLDALNLLGGLDIAPFMGLQQMARRCAWWWAYDACVVLCDRPAVVSAESGRVTMEFRDGWKVG